MTFRGEGAEDRLKRGGYGIPVAEVHAPGGDIACMQWNPAATMHAVTDEDGGSCAVPCFSKGLVGRNPCLGRADPRR